MIKSIVRLCTGLALLAATFAVGQPSWAADAWTTPPAVPAPLAVPAPAKLAAHFRGVGAQVYVCLAAPGAAGYAWTLQKPDAKLTDRQGVPTGTHGAGPVWTSNDGSSVIGKKLADAPSPAGDAIPWLLLRAEKTTGHGVFSDVTFIQRVQTQHGKAPTSGCDAGKKGAEARVDYSADYYFYAGGH